MLAWPGGCSLSGGGVETSGEIGGSRDHLAWGPTGLTSPTWTLMRFMHSGESMSVSLMAEGRIR